MKDLDYMNIADEVMRKIKRGAFLTVKAGDQLNLMTIGWVSFGFMWQKPILMVMVRSSRHTFGIIEKASDFTVTVPLSGMLNELNYCGSKSGRDVNKFNECNLKTDKSQKVDSPIIKGHTYNYECKIVYKAAINPVFLDKDCDSSIYPGKDYHTLYFAEIVACYGV
jgi:flavin reductase (DIM6/NTAB) family NADH-FMN oxidoreductase RutF